VQKRQKGSNRGGTNGLIIQTLSDSSKEERRQVASQQCAIQDLAEKTQEMRD